MGVYIYTPYSRTPWANTLAYYPLAEDCNDYSGNNRHGTNSNVTFSNWLATFNGTNSVVTVAHADWQKPTNNFTILAWFRVSTTAQTWCVVGKAQWSPYYQTNRYYYMGNQWDENSGKTFAWFAPWNEREVYPTSVFNLAPTPFTSWEWHLLGLTNEWTTKNQYFDWEVVATASKSTVSSTYSVPLTIGNVTHKTADMWFNGNISKVILENRTWTQQEILDFYNWTKSDLPTT